MDCLKEDVGDRNPYSIVRAGRSPDTPSGATWPAATSLPPPLRGRKSLSVFQCRQPRFERLYPRAQVVVLGAQIIDSQAQAVVLGAQVVVLGLKGLVLLVESLDGGQGDAVGVYGADGGLVGAQAEGGVEILGGRPHVADGRVFDLVVP